ncbi:hypothetical protein VTL71DRAFT_9326 [Oculimacula yallundae]|uniref:Serine hydrolase domain-containing protein n=1 Tax=Oculimacula yallundae TaxID=86028 RepID=A0ABR4BSR6_9HELO
MSFQMEPLPRIACFHGGGSAAAIFTEQCSQLTTQLSNTFEFVFFDAPFLRSAGPGVLPIFTYEKYGPYRTWFVDPTADPNPNPNPNSGSGSGSGSGSNPNSELDRGDGRKEDGSGEGGVERVLRLMSEYGEQRDGGEWVGVLGFSQGTRVASGLLLDQQRRKKLGLPRAEGGIDFKFGILCMGSFAPMVSDVIHASFTEDLIMIPTLHVHGTKDVFYEDGKKQVETYFDRKTVTVWDVAYHHAMPWYRADVLKFVELIRTLWAETKGA